MLHKVLKKLKEEGMIEDAPKGDASLNQKQDISNSGFHAKQNSEAGAYRQRSMGNRNIKPSR